MNTQAKRHRAFRRCALKLAIAGAAAAALGGIGAMPALAQLPAMPKSPVTINVVDVAGNLALTQDAFELYAKKNPNLVSKFNFT
jgi:putative spermidine/putrescine transport system substrate-binding protein